jgi:hypothetical protein
MKMDKYEYYADDLFLNFRFDSIGPRGTIKKIVVFTHMTSSLYSLGFGDLSKLGEFDDKIVSDNGDSFKILVTVATILNDFTEKYRNVAVHIEGSTESRTRLYQININRHWNIIEPEYIVLGLHKKRWHSFQKGKNYSAFMIYRNK